MSHISEQDEFLLSQWLDGDLDASEREALAARLEREPALRASLDEMRRVDAVLASQRTRQPVVDYAALRADIMAQVHEAAAPAIIRFPLWKWAGGAVAAAAAIALVLVLNRPAPQKPDTPVFVEESQPVQQLVDNGQPAPQPKHVSPTDNTPAPPALAMHRSPQTPAPVVRFNRRGTNTPREAVVAVKFVQSEELAKGIQSRDRERRSQPSWLYATEKPKARSAAAAPSSPFDTAM